MHNSCKKPCTLDHHKPIQKGSDRLQYHIWGPVPSQYRCATIARKAYSQKTDGMGDSEISIVLHSAHATQKPAEPHWRRRRDERGREICRECGTELGDGKAIGTAGTWYIAIRGSPGTLSSTRAGFLQLLHMSHSTPNGSFLCVFPMQGYVNDEPCSSSMHPLISSALLYRKRTSEG